jgi:hypothetical protein
MLWMGAEPRLQDIINLLRCHVFKIGCPDFSKYGGQILEANHLTQFEPFTGALYYKKAENACAWAGVDILSNKAERIGIWSPNIDNGSNDRKGRTLLVKAADLPTNTFQCLGIVADRGVNFNEDTVWVLLYKPTTDEYFLKRFDLTDNDSVTWDSADDTLILQGSVVQLGSRGDFGGTSGVAPFNLVPPKGRMRPLGINANGHLMCGSQVSTGREYMLFYNVANGDLMNTGPSGLDRDDFSSGLGFPPMQDAAFTDPAGGVRSLVPLDIQRTITSTLHGGAGGSDVYQFLWSPLIIDDDRKVFYYYSMPCSRFGAHGPIARFPETKVPPARDLVVLPQEHIRDRIDSFGLRIVHALETLNVGLDGSEPPDEMTRGRNIDPQASTFESWDWQNGSNVEVQDIFSTIIQTPSGVSNHAMLGYRNLVLGEVDLRIDGADLTDRTVLIEGGRVMYHIPLEYVPNGFKDGAPV